MMTKTSLWECNQSQESPLSLYIRCQDLSWSPVRLSAPRDIEDTDQRILEDTDQRLEVRGQTMSKLVWMFEFQLVLTSSVWNRIRVIMGDTRKTLRANSIKVWTLYYNIGWWMVGSPCDFRVSFGSKSFFFRF